MTHHRLRSPTPRRQPPLAHKHHDMIHQGSSSICSMSYIPNISERIKKTMMREMPNVKLAFKPMKKSDFLFSRTKDRVTIERQSNLVYSIPCGDCNDNYIGATKQLLENRLKQHKVSVDNNGVLGSRMLPRFVLITSVLYLSN